MDHTLPRAVSKFADQYPGIWQAFNQLARECHEHAGPLDERSRRLVKLGIAIGAQREGGVHSATRLGRKAGLSDEELLHAAILSITTIGWPGAQAALAWVKDVLSDPEHSAVTEADE